MVAFGIGYWLVVALVALMASLIFVANLARLGVRAVGVSAVVAGVDGRRVFWISLLLILIAALMLRLFR